MDKYRAVESELYKYKYRVAKIQKIENEIENLEPKYINAQSYEDIGRGNSVSNIVETNVINKLEIEDEKLNLLRIEKNKVENIELYLSVLTATERLVIEERYFHGKSWRDIASDLSYSESAVKKKRRNAINKIAEVFWKFTRLLPENYPFITRLWYIKFDYVLKLLQWGF